MDACQEAPRLADPFLITGPAVISFSGGRTSGYMLWRILQAHGGTLPPDVVVCFSNTGREMPATLDFVYACGSHWNVPIVWLEYALDPDTGIPTASVVSHNSAARAGEPFATMIRKKNMLPNPVARFCTEELKIRPVRDYCRAVMGWERWVNIVGLRRDEGGRVDKALKRNAAKKERFTAAMPLYDAGIEELDVLRFWRAQPFDLRLAGPWEGNCDGCFLKGRQKILRMMQDHPERMAWWPLSETLVVNGNGKTGTYRYGRPTYANMMHTASVMPRHDAQTTFIGEFPEDADVSCEEAVCGV